MESLSMMHVAAEVIDRAKKVHIRNPSRKNPREFGTGTRKMCRKITKYTTMVNRGFSRVQPIPRYVPLDFTLISRRTKYLSSVR